MLEMTDVLRVPELSHSHGMHGREVLPHHPLALLHPVTECLLQVESVLRHPERVRKVATHPLQPLRALGAGELPLLQLTDSPDLTAEMDILPEIMFYQIVDMTDPKYPWRPTGNLITGEILF